MKTTILAAMLLVPFQSARAQAPGYPPVLPYASIDGWNVLIDMDAGPTCYVLGTYAAGTIVRIGVDVSGASTLVVANPGWKSMRHGVSYATTIAFDGRDAWKGRSRYADDSGTGTMVFEFTDPAFVKRFMEASSLTLKVAGREVAKVSLTGSRKAMTAMVRCQSDVDAIAKDAEGGEDGMEEAPTAPLRTV
jgi:hypothetical protein